MFEHNFAYLGNEREHISGLCVRFTHRGMLMKRLLILFFLWLGALNGWAQAPSPAQMGITVGPPNAVQVLDSSQNWATIGYVDPITHVFTVSGAVGVPEAPTGSGVLYGRKNSAWSTIAHTDITDWNATLTPYALLASPDFSLVRPHCRLVRQGLHKLLATTVRSLLLRHM